MIIHKPNLVDLPPKQIAPPIIITKKDKINNVINYGLLLFFGLIIYFIYILYQTRQEENRKMCLLEEYQIEDIHSPNPHNVMEPKMYGTI